MENNGRYKSADELKIGDIVGFSHGWPGLRPTPAKVVGFLDRGSYKDPVLEDGMPVSTSQLVRMDKDGVEKHLAWVKEILEVTPPKDRKRRKEIGNEISILTRYIEELSK